ncbi:hypothetical protein [Nostoc sp.]|uniref:hypothetical protein n=1 Tax=Nostoc sp. TaxID=1180 RepID=UPI002FF87FC9
MKHYRDLQDTLRDLRSNGATIQCRLDGTSQELRKELERLENCTILKTGEVEIVDSKKTSISILSVDETTVVCGIKGESRILSVYWDDERDTAITVHKEVVVMNNSEVVEKNRDVCKIEIVGDGKGNYRAFPMTTIEGKPEWLYPTDNTKYHIIKARLTPYDTRSFSIYVDKDIQKPSIVTSQDICIVKMYDDVRCGITRYFPSIGTFIYVGGKWMYSERSSRGDVTWISIAQGARQHAFKVGAKVLLQHDISVAGKIDIYHIDKLFYNGLLLMAHCTNERTGNAQIIPMVQLHLPQGR